MRIITVEEHFQHPEVSGQVLQLGGLPAAMPLEALPDLAGALAPDPDVAAQLGGGRLTPAERSVLLRQRHAVQVVPRPPARPSRRLRSESVVVAGDRPRRRATRLRARGDGLVLRCGHRGQRAR
jgi:hypothetical protein